jgi:hypothetical protein
MTKIGVLSLTQILFIVIIFGILIYLHPQQTLLGNTINIAGKIDISHLISFTKFLNI